MKRGRNQAKARGDAADDGQGIVHDVVDDEQATRCSSEGAQAGGGC